MFHPLLIEDEKVAKGFAHGCGGKATVITVESKTAADISQADGSCQVFFCCSLRRFFCWFNLVDLDADECCSNSYADNNSMIFYIFLGQ